MGSVTPISAAIIAAIAALIGAFLGFIGTFLVARNNLKKEVSLKVAEYRIEWMNRLGDEISDFVESITLMSLSGNKTDHKLIAQINRAATRIDLSMNSKDENYLKIKSCMNALMEHAAKPGGLNLPAGSKNEYPELRRQMIDVSKSILNNEWKRTKQHLRDDTVEISALRSTSEPKLGYVYK